MAGRVWCPGDGINMPRVVFQCANRNGWNSNVYNKNFGRVVRKGGQVVMILLIKRETKKGLSIGLFKDYHGVLHLSGIEHSNTSICANRTEDVFAAVQFGKGDIVNFFVVRNQLRFHVPFGGLLFGYHLPCFYLLNIRFLLRT